MSENILKRVKCPKLTDVQNCSCLFDQKFKVQFKTTERKMKVTLQKLDSDFLSHSLIFKTVVGQLID